MKSTTFVMKTAQAHPTFYGFKAAEPCQTPRLGFLQAQLHGREGRPSRRRLTPVCELCGQVEQLLDLEVRQ